MIPRVVRDWEGENIGRPCGVARCVETDTGKPVTYNFAFAFSPRLVSDNLPLANISFA